MKLSEIATFVEDIISSDIALEHHVTTEFPLLKNIKCNTNEEV